jgi:hypothetical protein
MGQMRFAATKQKFMPGAGFPMSSHHAVGMGQGPHGYYGGGPHGTPYNPNYYGNRAMGPIFPAMHPNNMGAYMQNPQDIGEPHSPFPYHYSTQTPVTMNHFFHPQALNTPPMLVNQNNYGGTYGYVPGVQQHFGDYHVMPAMVNPNQPTVMMNAMQMHPALMQHPATIAMDEARFQETGVKLRSQSQSRQKLKTQSTFSPPWYAPPVAGGLGEKTSGSVPPGAAVVGTDLTQLQAPHQQTFNGVFDAAKKGDANKPSPVRAYSDDHPSDYQPAPLWPPAPPEPLFPLKSAANDKPAPPPPLPGTGL